jgi:phage protein D
MTDASEQIPDIQPGDETYAPEVDVRVRGAEVSLADVIELRVTQERDGLAGFSLLLANQYELETNRFRHSDADTFELDDPVEISLGYASGNNKLKMFVGEVTALAPTFPSSGLPTLSVTGVDVLGRLRNAKPEGNTRKSYPRRADWQVAEEVAQRHKLALSKDSNRTGRENPVVMQRDMDDLQFLLWLAKRNKYECAIKLENKKPVLYFGEPHSKQGDGVIKELGLTWGESLVSFSPRMSIGSQVSKVTVRGWDPKKKEPIEYTATLDDLKVKGKGKTGVEIVGKKSDAKVERVVDHAVQTVQEAKDLAVQLLTETANEFLTGSGETIGDPRICPQVTLKLGGLGKRFNGEYYVIKADHAFTSAGYTTTFEVERMQEGP